MPLVGISLSFLLGIIIASLLSLSAWIWFAISVSIVVLCRFLPDRFSQFSLRPVYFAMLLAFLLGAWRYQAAQPKINAFQVAFYNDRKDDLLITGSLAEPPDYRNTYTNLKIKVAAVDSGSGDLPVSGLMLARVPENQIYEYGERVRLRGQLETPPQDEEFSYRDYLAREGILSYMSMAEVTVLPGDDGGLYKTAVYKLKKNCSRIPIVSSMTRKPRCLPAFCSAWIPASPRNYKTRSRILAPRTSSRSPDSISPSSGESSFPFSRTSLENAAAPCLQ